MPLTGPQKASEHRNCHQRIVERVHRFAQFVGRESESLLPARSLHHQSRHSAGHLPHLLERRIADHTTRRHILLLLENYGLAAAGDYLHAVGERHGVTVKLEIQVYALGIARGIIEIDHRG